jgi:DNA invertase Pin-like site-specific DNA recombinase
VKKPRRAALYLRVGTDGRTVENQRLELEAAAQRHGWSVAGVFADGGIGGAKRRDQRPALDRLLKGVARKEFDLIASWSVDRLGRSLQDLLAFLGEVHAEGVDLYLHRQGVDTTTPAGKAMFQMMGVFAEFERAMIRERVNAGLQRAKAQGKTLGRPKVAPEIEEAVRASLRTGAGVLKTAATLGIGSSTVQRIKAAMPAGG